MNANFWNVNKFYTVTFEVENEKEWKKRENLLKIKSNIKTALYKILDCLLEQA